MLQGECQFSHDAVLHDKNRWGHGILTDTDYGIKETKEGEAEE